MLCLESLGKSTQFLSICNKKLDSLTETPFVGAIPAAGKVVLGGLQLTIAVVRAFFGLLYSLARWNRKEFVNGGIEIGFGILETFHGCVAAIPLIELFSKGGKAEDNIAKGLNKGEWKDFNPFWVCKALGKVVHGVYALTFGLFFLIFGFWNKTGREEGNKALRFGISRVIIGTLETIPFVRLEKNKEPSTGAPL